MRRMKQIDDEVFASYLDCPRKAFLQLHRREGMVTEFECHMRSRVQEYLVDATDRLLSESLGRGILRRAKLTPSTDLKDHTLVLARSVSTACLDAGATVILRSGSQGKGDFVPVHFHRYAPITTREKLIVGYRAAVVAELTGQPPPHGLIVHGPLFETTRIAVASPLSKARSIVSQLNEMVRNESVPLCLNPHCDICRFREFCRDQAVKEDSLSLLTGIRQGHIENLRSRGIFTVHQLSFTFRPRRLPKRAKNPAKPRHFALQAQAIRENRTFIHGTPELSNRINRLYFDVEGVPGSGLYYLIGVLAETGKDMQYRAFWADDDQAQKAMFDEFCRFVGSFPDAVLFHYGHYDSKALTSLATLAAGERRSSDDDVLSFCHNVLPALHSHCYFPIHSIRLRDVGRFLGCRLASTIQSGAYSIVFRERWERTRQDSLRDELIAYNREDCLALKAVCDFIRACPSMASAGGTIPGRTEAVASSESLRKPDDGNRPTFKKAEFALPEFEQANRCAYFDYQRERVHARPERKRHSVPKGRRPRASRQRPAGKPTVIGCDSCASCGSRRLGLIKVHERHLIDLKFFKTGIGVKRWQPHYAIREYRCRDCGETVIPPGLAFHPRSRTVYGHGLMCWCVYHNIVGKQSMLQVGRSLRELFDLDVPYTYVYRFRSAMASYYRPLYDEILEAVLCSDVINIDETPVKLRKTTGYVWILATSEKVCCLFRNSREGGFLKDLLSDFSGVLVSDFFTAYDSIECRHQKCLIHLMRDINDDLRKRPFDSELNLVARLFARALADCVASIDRWGLSGYHLRKHVKQADRMLAKVTAGQFTSGAAQKYQKRFQKYGPNLFTFLLHDNVPWNNNNAEHAVHYFAKLRRFTDGTFTERSIGELLTLVSVLQTCEYSDVNSLRFLLSGEVNLAGLNAQSGSRRNKDKRGTTGK